MEVVEIRIAVTSTGFWLRLLVWAEIDDAGFMETCNRTGPFHYPPTKSLGLRTAQSFPISYG